MSTFLMAVLNWMLDLACLLMWLNWRSLGFVAFPRRPLTLGGNVRPAQTGPVQRGRWLFWLAAVLALRGVVYWQIGPAVHWTPSIQLWAVSVPFRSDFLTRALLFSLASFGVMLGAFYACLLLLSVINRRLEEPNQWHQAVRLHLGALERLPVPFKLFLPALVAGLVWYASAWGLKAMGILPPPASGHHLWQQSAVVGAASVLVWKYALLGVLILHMVHTYVYIGRYEILTYISRTASALLRPLEALPLRTRRIDFAPGVAIALVLGMTEVWRQALFTWFQRLL